MRCNGSSVHCKQNVNNSNCCAVACGSVGRVVSSNNTRGPWFASSHWWNFKYDLLFFSMVDEAFNNAQQQRPFVLGNEQSFHIFQRACSSDLKLKHGIIITSLIYFCPFIITIQIWIEKRIDVALGNKTHGCRMVGTNVSTELRGRLKLRFLLVQPLVVAPDSKLFCSN